ncbi:MAG: CheR family methyltransferase [Myxococcales bacterium]|nr:CheR family methyltransferase [Myxococcales bacterium]
MSTSPKCTTVRGADAEHRRRALLALERRAPGDAVRAALDAFADIDWRVRKEAAALVGRCADDAAIGLLVDRLARSEEPSIRGACLEAIALLGERASSALFETLARTPPGRRRFLIEALGETRAEAAVRVLSQIARESNPHEAVAAIDALGRIGGPRATEALLPLLQTPDRFLRLAVLDALERCRARIPWRLLGDHLAEPAARRAVVGLLGRCGDPRAVEPLLARLREADDALFVQTTRGLATLVAECPPAFDVLLERAPSLDARARAKLRRLVGDGPPQTRAAAALLLVASREVEALPQIASLAATEGLSPQARSALRRWGEPRAIALLEEPESDAAPGWERASRFATDGRRARLRGHVAPSAVEIEPDRARIGASAQSASPRTGSAGEGSPSLSVDALRALGDLLAERYGFALSDEAAFSVERRLRERLRALGIDSFADYCRHLRQHPDGPAELERAAELLTTHETYFFREPEQLRAFRDVLLPRLRERGEARGLRRLAVWSAGCSTGEEVYTIAMLVEESGLFEGWDVRIFGSDLSRRALAAARRAVYGASSFRAMPSGYERCFREVEDGLEVQPRLRAMCHFSRLNLLDGVRAAAAGRVDVVFCRNVLIYLLPEARRRVLDVLHARLLPGGYLLLGHSESLLHVTTAFEIVHAGDELVYRKPVLGGTTG